MNKAEVKLVWKIGTYFQIQKRSPYTVTIWTTKCPKKGTWVRLVSLILLSTNSCHSILQQYKQLHWIVPQDLFGPPDSVYRTSSLLYISTFSYYCYSYFQKWKYVVLFLDVFLLLLNTTPVFVLTSSFKYVYGCRLRNYTEIQSYLIWIPGSPL